MFLLEPADLGSDAHGDRLVVAGDSPVQSEFEQLDFEKLRSDLAS